MISILTISLPSLMVLVGILLNQNGLNQLNGRMTALEASMNSLRGAMSSLRMSFHNDVVMLLERDNKLAERVARLERV